ncbi:ras guanine nucleotide exchange factor i-related [Anaeramoeba flamelloides]|uniref:Ras guanine nucleotide exchange factor i-related n=1 Tax=Anaeramoeba flamelloides TaxID=1746091 RepID=A0AAV7Y9I3_9EUKA|nr:ras guanine nucleotide exchange factor i-related [Anaeramoeba flamelloides]
MTNNNESQLNSLRNFNNFGSGGFTGFRDRLKQSKKQEEVKTNRTKTTNLEIRNGNNSTQKPFSIKSGSTKQTNISTLKKNPNSSQPKKHQEIKEEHKEIKFQRHPQELQRPKEIKKIYQKEETQKEIKKVITYSKSDQNIITGTKMNTNSNTNNRNNTKQYQSQTQIKWLSKSPMPTQLQRRKSFSKTPQIKSTSTTDLQNYLKLNPNLQNKIQLSLEKKRQERVKEKEKEKEKETIQKEKENIEKETTRNKKQNSERVDEIDQIRKDKSAWLKYVLNKNPQLQNFRERLFPLSRSESLSRIYDAGKEKTKEKLSRPIMLQLILQHLTSVGYQKTKKALEKESKIKYQQRYLRDSRLQNLIRASIKNVDFIWDKTIDEYSTEQNMNQKFTSGISLVKHFQSLGIEQEDDDEDELTSIWDDEEENNIIYSEIKEKENTEIIAASLNKLVTLLTHEDQRNVTYIKTFLMTYQSFTTPKKLLTKLIQRFNIPSEKEEIYKGRKKIIRLRVCNFLKFWIADYFEDFQPKLLPELENFIENEIKNANMSKMANNLKEIIERNLNENDELKDYTFLDPPPDPKLPKNIFSPKLSLLDVPPEEIARQMTLLEFQIYERIKPSEFLKLAWSQPKIRHKSPNVLSLINRANMVTSWAKTIIIKKELCLVRTKVLRKFIKIAQHLRKLKNFNGLMSILNAMLSQEIKRLKFTFGNIPKKYLEMLKRLRSELSSDKSYSRYRTLIKQTIPPCIPHFALCLQDLISIENGDEDEIQGLINFGKRRLIYDIINEIQRYQKSPYNFQSIHQISTLLEQLPILDDSELYSRSLKLEPPYSVKEDIR